MFPRNKAPFRRPKRESKKIVVLSLVASKAEYLSFELEEKNQREAEAKTMQHISSYPLLL
jgi:hypothetical protein